METGFQFFGNRLRGFGAAKIFFLRLRRAGTGGLWRLWERADRIARVKRTYPVELMWCANPPGRSGRGLRDPMGWQFPRGVEKQLLADCTGSVLHLFSSRSKFGTRIDIDPIVKPDVLADAWLPPFAPQSFDVVILDPPYIRLNSQEKNSLFRAAAEIARVRVVWFHTIWISTPPGLAPEKAWLVRVGDSCHVRCLQYFTIRKRYGFETHFKRGPAMKYNRWLAQPQALPGFEASK